MSSNRTYELRARTRAGVAAQSGQVLNESPSLVDLDNYSIEVEPLWGDLDPSAEAAGAVRSYHDVVLSRPPSPRRERPVQPSISPLGGPDRARMPNPLDDESRAGREAEDDASEEVIETPDKPEYIQWTKVVHRKRARSDGSLPNKNTLTSEQRETVKIGRAHV